ncbi:MAG: queuosine precursor transporter [Bacteroidales bacterium]|nr:queuosine precursor transporter [Candidatus Colicola faecequi]
MKKTYNNLTLLNIIFVVSIVISNVVGCKVIDLGFSIAGIPLLLSGGAITYAFTFLCTDIIGELWGKYEANAAVKRGFIGQIFAIALIFATMYTPTNDATMQAAYEKLLGQSFMFTVGSLAAYYCSQKWDVWIFHRVRDYFGGKQNLRWVWNNASTLTSQIIDTTIYALVAFGIGCGWLWQENGLAGIVSIIAGQYLLKMCLAILDTPFFYFFTKQNN